MAGIVRPRNFPIRKPQDNQQDHDGPEEYHVVLLDNGRSTITGQRRGSLKDVTAHAHRYAEQVNARGLGAQSIWAPRGKK